jgi:hypothetical protein
VAISNFRNPNISPPAPAGFSVRVKMTRVAKITNAHHLDAKKLFCIFLDMEKQITWTVAAISEFAKAKALSAKQAFNYLSLFKGLDFLQDHYGAEHMLSFEDTVDDLTAICQRNGGQIL